MKDTTSEDAEVPYGGAAYGFVRRSPGSTGTVGGVSYGERLSLAHPEEKHSAFHKDNINRKVKFDWVGVRYNIEDSYSFKTRGSDKDLFKHSLYRSMLDAAAAYLVFSPAGERLRATKVFQNVEAAARNVRRATALEFPPEDLGVLKKYGLLHAHEVGGYIGNAPLYEMPINAKPSSRLSAAIDAFSKAGDSRGKFVNSVAAEMLSPLGFRRLGGVVRPRSDGLALKFDSKGRDKLVEGLKQLPPLVVLTALQNTMHRRTVYEVSSAEVTST
jgi:hypothetical protein